MCYDDAPDLQQTDDHEDCGGTGEEGRVSVFTALTVPVGEENRMEEQIRQVLPKEKGQDGESYGCYGGMSVHGINETLSLFVSIYTVYP